jgi:hypothetical protein
MRFETPFYTNYGEFYELHEFLFTNFYLRIYELNEFLFTQLFIYEFTN